MSRRPTSDFRLTLCSLLGALSLSLVAASGAQTPPAVPGGNSFAAQGRVCLYVNVQDEFDRTVKAVRAVLGTSGDEALQEKLNHTIFKGLLNRVIGGSASSAAEAYLDDDGDSLPEADNRVVQKLEEAGFVALANLARRDYSTLAPGTSDDAASDAGNQRTKGAGSQLAADAVRQSTVGAGSQPAKGAGSQLAPDAVRQSTVGAGNQPAKGAGSQLAPDAVRQSTAGAGDQLATEAGAPGESRRDSNIPHIEGRLENKYVSRRERASREGHCHSAPSDEKCPGTTQETATQPSLPTRSHLLTEPQPRVSVASQRPIGDASVRHVTAADQSAGSLADDASAGGRIVNEDGVPIVEDDLYWSDEIEAATPKGFSEDELDQWKAHLAQQSVRSFEPGSLTKCGRDKNRFIVLEDGSKLCVRYRYPLVTSMTGELNSYHLARMLGLTNLPPLHVSMATTNGSFWRGQAANFEEAGWEEGKPVLLTKWIEGLGKAYLPELLVQGPHPVGSHTQGLRALNMTELTSLLQWSDLILFDYLIAHFDRFTINLSSVRYYNSTALLRSEVHNLVQDPVTKQLWIVDNESGLLDGYSYLLVTDSQDSLMQGLLHEEMLRMLCLFRRSTARRVRALLAHPSPARLLSERVRGQDPAAGGALPELDGIQRHAQMLRQRLRQIQAWMLECQERNARERLKG